MKEFENFEKKVKLVTRDLQYKGSILNVYKDTVDVGGHITHWDYISKCNAAAIIPVLPNGNILMVKQYRLAVDKFTIELPAGKIDEGENFIDCAKRELEEETGYRSDEIEFLCDTYTAAAFCDEIVRIFVAKNLIKSKQNFDEDEELHVQEWSIEKLKKEIFSGNIKDGKTVAGVMAYIVQKK